MRWVEQASMQILITKPLASATSKTFKAGFFAGLKSLLRFSDRARFTPLELVTGDLLVDYSAFHHKNRIL